MVFTVADSTQSGTPLYNELAKLGFRRTHRMLYRPYCPDCSACHSSRIRIREFKPSRSQRKVLSRNGHLRRVVSTPSADLEQYGLFLKYLHERHAGGPMCSFDYDTFVDMIEKSPVSTRFVAYYSGDPDDKSPNRLVAAGLTDVLEDGLSMVYSFFDPALSRDSVGTHIILDHVALGRELELEFVYLGFWVPGSSKMDYKARFSPLEVFRNGSWVDLTQTNGCQART